MVGDTMLSVVPAQVFARIRHNFRPACQAKQGRIMNTGSSNSDSTEWRDLYKAALFEVDNARLPERIAQAEKALTLALLLPPIIVLMIAPPNGFGRQ